MRRLVPIALGIAASALVLFMLMPQECQDLQRGQIDVVIGSQPKCPEVSSRAGIDYSNDAFGSWVSNLAGAVVGVTIAVLVERKLESQ